MRGAADKRRGARVKERTVHYTYERVLDTSDRNDRALLRLITIALTDAPTDVVRVSHRGGSVVCCLDKRKRLRVVADYRCW